MLCVKLTAAQIGQKRGASAIYTISGCLTAETPLLLPREHRAMASDAKLQDVRGPHLPTDFVGYMTNALD